MKRKHVTPDNYLDKVPAHNPAIGWSINDTGAVTLEIENKGVVNRIAQKILKKPKITYIHLDEHGSFVWPLIDGETDILTLGKAVDEHFGEAAHPLYERLAKFFQILDSYGFITWVE